MTPGVARRDIYCRDEASSGIIMRSGCILMRRHLIAAVQHPCPPGRAAINPRESLVGIATGFRDRRGEIKRRAAFRRPEQVPLRDERGMVFV